MDKLKGIDYERAASRAPQKVDEAVDNLKGFNEKVKEVLKRKLVQYYVWKYRTYLELKQRRVFMLKSLRHFYTTIRMYAEWLKPYLLNVRRLSQQQAHG
jgi:elongation factor P hydroxylase